MCDTLFSITQSFYKFLKKRRHSPLILTYDTTITMTRKGFWSPVTTKKSSEILLKKS